MQRTNHQSPLLLSLVVDLYLQQHDKPCPEVYPDGCWEFSEGLWHFAFNGHKTEQQGGPPGGMDPMISPFNLAVFRNGWLTGMVGPAGGEMMTDMEDEAIAVVQGLLETPKGE